MLAGDLVTPNSFHAKEVDGNFPLLLLSWQGWLPGSILPWPEKKKGWMSSQCRLIWKISVTLGSWGEELFNQPSCRWATHLLHGIRMYCPFAHGTMTGRTYLSVRSSLASLFSCCTIIWSILSMFSVSHISCNKKTTSYVVGSLPLKKAYSSMDTFLTRWRATPLGCWAPLMPTEVQRYSQHSAPCRMGQ